MTMATERVCWHWNSFLNESCETGWWPPRTFDVYLLHKRGMPSRAWGSTEKSFLYLLFLFLSWESWQWSGCSPRGGEDFTSCQLIKPDRTKRLFVVRLIYFLFGFHCAVKNQCCHLRETFVDSVPCLKNAINWLRSMLTIRFYSLNSVYVPSCNSRLIVTQFRWLNAAIRGASCAARGANAEDGVEYKSW